MYKNLVVWDRSARSCCWRKITYPKSLYSALLNSRLPNAKAVPLLPGKAWHITSDDVLTKVRRNYSDTAYPSLLGGLGLQNCHALQDLTPHCTSTHPSWRDYLLESLSPLPRAYYVGQCRSMTGFLNCLVPWTTVPPF